MLDLCHFSKNFYTQLVNQQYMASVAPRNTNNLQIKSLIYLHILRLQCKYWNEKWSSFCACTKPKLRTVYPKILLTMLCTCIDNTTSYLIFFCYIAC